MPLEEFPTETEKFSDLTCGVLDSPQRRRGGRGSKPRAGLTHRQGCQARGPFLRAGYTHWSTAGVCLQGSVQGFFASWFPEDLFLEPKRIFFKRQEFLILVPSRDNKTQRPTRGWREKALPTTGEPFLGLGKTAQLHPGDSCHAGARVADIQRRQIFRFLCEKSSDFSSLQLI